MTVQAYLKNIVAKTYNTDSEKIEVIGNQAVDKDKLQKDTFYIQVAMVKPYVEDEDGSLSAFQTHFGAGLFIINSFVQYKNTYNLINH